MVKLNFRIRFFFMYRVYDWEWMYENLFDIGNDWTNNNAICRNLYQKHVIQSITHGVCKCYRFICYTLSLNCNTPSFSEGTCFMVYALEKSTYDCGHRLDTIYVPFCFGDKYDDTRASSCTPFINWIEFVQLINGCPTKFEIGNYEFVT